MFSTARETLSGESQQGKWQVYAKRGDVWLPFGSPSPLPQAEALVATMRSEGRVGQPHCVPL